MKKLENKIAIITGATSGIGECTAKLFAKNGAIVILVGRNVERGTKIEKEITQDGMIAKFIVCDVSNEEQVKQMIHDVIETFKKIDILFNNAGTFLPSVEIERLELDDWKQTFNTNVDGCFLVTKHAKMHLIENNGVILNNASIAGMHSYAVGRSYAYSASKSAIIQFSRTMAMNYAEEGVRVNCICPGIISTPIFYGFDLKMYEGRIPMKRVGTPEEVAKVALFLVSNDSAYVTGAVIPIDGGASI